MLTLYTVPTQLRYVVPRSFATVEYGPYVVNTWLLNYTIARGRAQQAVQPQFANPSGLGSFNAVHKPMNFTESCTSLGGI